MTNPPESMSPERQIDAEKQMALVRDRFTRTARAFADYVLKERVFEAERLLRLAAPRGTEFAIDVACGPATLARVFAPHVRSIFGLDLTPAMLERARREATERKLTNFCALRGNVLQMPFRDATFDLVVTSYSIHHLPDAAAAIGEISRILKRGGKFALLDMVVSENAKVAKACNELETVRDASHTRALSVSGFEKLLAARSLHIIQHEVIDHPRHFDQWMHTAGWKRGDKEYEATRKLLEDSMHGDTAGFHPKFLDGPSEGAADERPDIELTHTGFYFAAEKK